jgi:hypothetical protein
VAIVPSIQFVMGMLPRLESMEIVAEPLDIESRKD